MPASRRVWERALAAAVAVQLTVGVTAAYARVGQHRHTPELADGGSVVVRRGVACMVLAHPDHPAFARTILAECDAAVPRVTALWGSDWSQRVVVVLPDSPAELARLVPDAGDLGQIAAITTADVATRGRPAGDHVFVNPATYAQLSSVGRRVVMTHEITHVATRAATGSQVPMWFVEGLADYVGYHDVGIPLAVSAQELRADLRAGTIPTDLPADAAFDGSRGDLAATYEQSWLAVMLLARTYGPRAVMALYRHVGGDPRPGALDRALRRDLHTTLLAFSRAWRADLRRLLA